MLYTHTQKFLPSSYYDEFLPPVSRWTSLAGISLMGTVGTAIALSSYIKYNVTVKTGATVRPTGDIRLVQPEIEGTIKSIFVKENQTVKQGDIIARLDDLEIHIKNNQLQANLQENKLQLIQIDAQVNALDNQIEAEKKVIEWTVASAKAELTRSQREYNDQQVKTQSEWQASQANLQKSEANLQKAKADLDFAQLDRDRYQQLAEIGAVSKREFEQRKLAVEQAKAVVDSEQRAIDIAKANLQSARAAINPSAAIVAIAKQKIAQETVRGKSTIAAFLREKNALIQKRIEMNNQIKQAKKELEKNQLQLQNTLIRATSDGTILKLNLRNPGQVVRPSESVAEIVPHNTPLVIKAIIPASDIKNVEVGQNVQLRVDACPYPDYGTLHGVVTAVSPDAIVPQNNNSSTSSPAATTPITSYFEATIKPKTISFGNNNHHCSIQAGMDAKADIISKEETALEFMLRKARLITDI
ncbi:MULTISPECIES: HlyD family secretion protein [Nostocales]|uniref:Hemolysin D n=3 Tax=Nostocales TaxID=1161 RepID=A0A0C1QX39_9CYAN|nr:HlyD family efflux transporter periplasmic adaptor subunit [Tolypothrix bouteillei]KAF3885929.1 HlyD family efflux transporter periplasmic adaptor subunit [Tolypothrix bouteillei VB521301]